MQTQVPAPGSAKILASTRVKLRLAGMSGVILLMGVLLAPSAAPTAIAPLEERTAPLLEEQVQRQQVIAQPFAGVQEIAGRLRQHAVSIPATVPAAVPTLTDYSEDRRAADDAGYGVFVSDRYVLTHAAALDGRLSVRVVTATGTITDAAVVGYDTSTALVLLETPTEGGPAAPIAREPPSAGALIVAVGASDGRDVAVPLFVTRVASDRFFTGVAGDASPPGAPVYDLEGTLLGVSAGPGSNGQVLRAIDAAERLLARAAQGEQTVSFGLAFQDIDGALTGVFGDRGALVSDVVQDGPSARAGVMAGDVLLSVAGSEIASAREATGALASAPPDRPSALTVSRRGRERVIDVMPASAYSVAALAREAGGDAGLPEAGLLFPRDVLDTAAIPPTAQVLSVNGIAVTTAAQAARALRSGRPAVVALRHGDARYFAVIQVSR